MKHLFSKLTGTFRNLLSTTHQATSNTLWLLIEHIAKILSEFIVVFMLARYLGPNQFGLLSYATALLSFGIIVAKLGLDDVAVRFLVEQNKREKHILATCFLIKLFAGLLVYILLLILTHKSQQQEIAQLTTILGLVLPIQAFEVLRFSFKANLNSRPLVISNSISLLISCLMKAICVVTQQSLQIFALCILLDTVISLTNIYIAYYFTKRRGVYFFIASTNQIKHLLNASFPVLISGIAITAYMRADQIMIKEMLGTEALGLYSAASKISEGWYFLPTIVTMSLVPVAVKLKKENQVNYERLFKLLSRYLFFVSVGVAIILSIFSAPIIRLLFGDEYIASKTVLIVHSLGGIFVCMRLVLSLWSIVEDKAEKMIINTAVGALINISLNLFFIQKLGILGAAVSTVIARSFAGIFASCFIRELRPIFKIQLQALGR